MYGFVEVGTDSKCLQLFLDNFEKFILARDLNLFYKGQVPNIAGLVFHGVVVIDQGSKEIVIKVPTLIGLSDLKNNKKSSVGIALAKGSEILIIDRVRYFRVSSND